MVLVRCDPSRRVPGRRRGMGLAFLALLAYLLLPLGAMPMARAGMPGEDICSSTSAKPSPGAPAGGHDSPCCTAHCLACGGLGGLPSTAAAPFLPGPEAAAILPWVPAAALSESHASPFAARAPPSHA